MDRRAPPFSFRHTTIDLKTTGPFDILKSLADVASADMDAVVDGS
jgi:hypothetical protein